MSVTEFAEMSKDEVIAEFEHGFVVVPGEQGSLEAVDVAAYLLAEYGALAPVASQETLYRCQAVALGLLGRPLYGDPIEAGADGPVIGAVRTREHLQGHLVVGVTDGDAGLLTQQERSIVDLTTLLMKEAGQCDLVRTTRAGSPWRLARERAGADAVVRLTDLVEEFTGRLHSWVRGVTESQDAGKT